MMLRQVVLGSLLAVVSMGSVADTLWLDNGDRVSGKVEFLDAGKLVLRTEYAGTVSVNIARVRTFTSEEPVLVRLKNGSEYTVQLAEADTAALLQSSQQLADQLASVNALLAAAY